MSKHEMNAVVAVGLALSLVGGAASVASIAAMGRSSSDVARPADTRKTSRLVELVGSQVTEESRVEAAQSGEPMSSPKTNDPAADDGELHDARNLEVGYSFDSDWYSLSENEHIDAYDMDVQCDFFVSYPQLEGDFEHLDEINDLLRSTAMRTVRTYYEDPSEQAIETVKSILASDEDGYFKPTDADAMLSSTVDYAISYNSDDLLSVCFSDNYCLGSYAFDSIEMRTVNVNLETGETYELADVMEVNEAIAMTWIDNLVQADGTDANKDGVLTDDECFSVRLVGREALAQALQGEGDLAWRVGTNFFVDGNGRVNVNANYWLSGSNGEGFVRGWWDVTVPEDQLEVVRKDSPFWDVLG